MLGSSPNCRPKFAQFRKTYSGGWQAHLTSSPSGARAFGPHTSGLAKLPRGACQPPDMCIFQNRLHSNEIFKEIFEYIWCCYGVNNSLNCQNPKFGVKILKNGLTGGFWILLKIAHGYAILLDCFYNSFYT